MDKKIALIILGMHRSGTSALTGVLNLMGVSLGKELLQPQPDNPKGFFENKEITLFNEKVLLPILDSTWWDLKPVKIEQLINSNDLIEKAKDIITRNFQEETIFAIKDPRMCILFPFWEKVLKDLGIDIKVIIPLRNPYEVAMSLKHRNSFTLEHGVLLWCKHVLYAEHYSRNYKRVFVYFDELLNNPKKVIKKIKYKLNIIFPQNFESVHKEIEEFLEKNLKHYNFTNTIPIEIPFIKKIVGLFYPKLAKLNYQYLNKLKNQYNTIVEFMYRAIGSKSLTSVIEYKEEIISRYFDLFKIDNVNFNLLTRTFSFGGLACLKKEMEYKYSLIAKIKEQLVNIEWNLPSPWYAQNNPENPHSKNARFFLPDLKISEDVVIEIYIAEDNAIKELLSRLKIKV